MQTNEKNPNVVETFEYRGWGMAIHKSTRSEGKGFFQWECTPPKDTLVSFRGWRNGSPVVKTKEDARVRATLEVDAHLEHEDKIRRCLESPNPMFAVNFALDQTIGYYNGQHFNDKNEETAMINVTVSHPEAADHLFTDLQAALALAQSHDGCVEPIFDLEEFKSREDTW